MRILVCTFQRRSSEESIEFQWVIEGLCCNCKRFGNEVLGEDGPRDEDSLMSPPQNGCKALRCHRHGHRMDSIVGRVYDSSGQVGVSKML
jgi:hypothetical protein